MSCTLVCAAKKRRMQRLCMRAFMRHRVAFSVGGLENNDPRRLYVKSGSCFSLTVLVFVFSHDGDERVRRVVRAKAKPSSGQHGFESTTRYRLSAKEAPVSRGGR